MKRAVSTTFARRALPVALAAAVLLPGCGWKKEIEKLKASNQELTQTKQNLEGQLTSVGVESAEMQATLDEVQKGLEELRTKELQVIRSSIQVVQEGKPKSKQRDQLQLEMETIKTAIKENLDKLARLEKEKKAAEAKAAASGKKVAELSKQVTAFERLVAEMRSQLEEKQTMIAELEEKVLQLSQTVETQAGVIKEKEEVIETQTTEINKAYVAIDSKKALKLKGLIVKKGAVVGLGGSWIRTGKFDPEIFREIDVRKETEFSIGTVAKKAIVLSDHTKDSYEIVDNPPDGCTLKIKDATEFWKGSKYLVVMTPD
jgi:chromosome segregation ATPase